MGASINVYSDLLALAGNPDIKWHKNDIINALQWAAAVEARTIQDLGAKPDKLEDAEEAACGQPPLGALRHDMESLRHARQTLLLAILNQRGLTEERLLAILSVLASTAQTLPAAESSEAHSCQAVPLAEIQQHQASRPASLASLGSLTEWLAPVVALSDSIDEGRSMLDRSTRRRLLKEHGIISSCSSTAGDGERAGSTLGGKCMAVPDLSRFQSLSAFAEAWCHGGLSPAEKACMVAKADAQALAHITSPAAAQALGMAQLLLVQLPADAGQEARSLALQTRLSALAAHSGPALALRLCCCAALSADWQGVTQHLSHSCQSGLVGRAQWAADQIGGSSRMPMHFGVAPSRTLSSSAAGSCRTQPTGQDSACRPAGFVPAKRGRDAEGAAGSAAKRLIGHPAAAEAGSAEQEHAGSGGRAAGADDASITGAAAALRLVQRLLAGKCTEILCGGAAAAEQAEAAQAAAMTLHPGLVSEVARRSFAACSAYLAHLHRAANDSARSQDAILGFVHLLRLGGSSRRLTEAALQRCICS